MCRRRKAIGKGIEATGKKVINVGHRAWAEWGMRASEIRMNDPAL